MQVQRRPKEEINNKIVVPTSFVRQSGREPASPEAGNPRKEKA
jgi:hypothetical protein